LFVCRLHAAVRTGLLSNNRKHYRAPLPKPAVQLYTQLWHNPLLRALLLLLLLLLQRVTNPDDA
jgi:hypothetical protein